MQPETGVLLVNLGTPKNPSVKDVKEYLREFLCDARVIDISPIARFFLVNFIIVPFRVRKSSQIYKELWTENGSPILFHSKSVQQNLQNTLGDKFFVELAMRYQHPSLKDMLKSMESKNYKKIIIIPLFPQYASATTGSIIEKIMKEISRWVIIPEIKFISQFYDADGFADTIVEQAKKYNIDEYDHILFSYHGLPTRQVDKVYGDGTLCKDQNCDNEINKENKYCYKATCYATTRLLVEKLNIQKEKYTVCFQSRLNKNWLEPFTDQVIIELAKKGAKNILVFSPSFVSDCLETIIEIGKEYQELFKAHGGEKIQLVESLNDHPLWIKSLKNIVLQNC